MGLISRRHFLWLGVGTVLSGVWGGPRRAIAAERRKPKVVAEKISILKECVRCTGCLAVCPKDALGLTPAGLTVDNAKCIACGYCAAACPVHAIRINTGPIDG